MKTPKGIGSTSSPFILHRQEQTLDALKKGEVEDGRISQKLPVDQIVLFGLKEEFLLDGLKKFPDPRKSWEIPIEV